MRGRETERQRDRKMEREGDNGKWLEQATRDTDIPDETFNNTECAKCRSYGVDQCWLCTLWSALPLGHGSCVGICRVVCPLSAPRPRPCVKADTPTSRSALLHRAHPVYDTDMLFISDWNSVHVAICAQGDLSAVVAWLPPLLPWRKVFSTSLRARFAWRSGG